MTMGELCAECRNWFLREIIRGDFRIVEGVIQPVPSIPDGVYIRIDGSIYNDGVWQYPCVGLPDEEFYGAVWIMAVPEDFKALQAEIDAWETASAEAVKTASDNALSSPFTAEAFADYSYQRKSVLPDGPTTWKDPRLGFAARVNRWRKANNAVPV